MADTKYLIKHGHTWLVSVTVPRNLRGAAGKVRFKRSLRTSSVTEANLRKYAVIAEFKARLGLLSTGRESSDSLEATYYEPHGPARNRLLVQRAQPSACETFVKDRLEIWLASISVAEQTKGHHRVAVERFLTDIGRSKTFERTTRKEASGFTDAMLQSSGLSRRTVDRYRTSLSSYWQWSISRGAQTENPWTGLALGVRKNRNFRKALEDEALLRLLRGTYKTTRYRDLVHDLTRLALITGARADEMCALLRSGVVKKEDGYWLSIMDGKTAAVVREVPVHDSAVHIIERRLAEKDNYLFKGLLPGGPDAKRSWHFTKAYGRFRVQKDVAVIGKGRDFHALRNTFIAMMEGEEVPESTVKLLVGHARDSMTFGHYSKGERVKLRDAINRLRFNPTVMSAIQSPSTQKSAAAQ
jgi:integrase